MHRPVVRPPRPPAHRSARTAIGAAFAGACLALLAGCAGLPPAAPQPLLRDAAFAPPSAPVDAAAVLEPSAAMRDWLARTALQRQDDPPRRLVELLFRREALAIDYAGVTRTAAEAFDARTGNCLSLVAMTTALAKAAGIPVQLRSVAVAPSWSRSDDLLATVGHVNVALGWPAAARAGARSDPVVDFVPAEATAGARWRPIAEHNLVARFMNNRAAEALADGRLDDAYWLAREAVRQDPHFSAGHNTLAVVYRRRGLRDAAEQVWRGLLAREPANVDALANLSALLRGGGRPAEADALDRRLAAIEPVPPFHWFDAGLQALRDGDVRAARELFAREVERDAGHHEFHFWLARAEWLLGRGAAARRQLELARETGPTPQVQALYAAKLAGLDAARR